MPHCPVVVGRRARAIGGPRRVDLAQMIVNGAERAGQTTARDCRASSFASEQTGADHGARRQEAFRLSYNLCRGAAGHREGGSDLLESAWRGVASIAHAASPGELRLFFSFSNMLFACVDALS
jgi:hypothetical protein